MTDDDTLFRAIAVQRGYLTEQQFQTALRACEETHATSLREFLVARKWISRRDLEELNALIESESAKRAGNGKSARSEVTQADEQTVDQGLVSDSWEETIDFEPPVQRRELLDTEIHSTESRTRYSLTRVQGQGGLGQVWLAVDETLGREVALKEIRSDRRADRETHQRLLQEAQITGQLEHPNIVPVYELSHGDDGKPFYTMRFLRGQALNERIKQYHKKRHGGPHDLLELRQMLNIFVCACQAMAYAHARGVVHRDLKPHNIMLGDFGEVMVIDWGLAKLVGRDKEDLDRRAVQAAASSTLDATVEGKLMGSPAYMAPEQAKGEITLLDERTDIYGLGAILFAMLAGLPPHRGSQSGNSAKDTRSLIRQITDGPTPQARIADAHVPKSLEAICAKAMAKKRAERYRSAAELADDVTRWLADEPVSAHRDSWAARASRWLRHHRTWAQAVAAILISVTLIASTASVLIWQAHARLASALSAEERSRQEAERALVAEQTALAAEHTALEAERLARAEATRRFQEARNAIDKSLTGVSEALRFFPGVEPARRALLEESADDYERFAQEKSDDPELQFEAGRARLRLGDVRRLLMQHDEAQKAYLSAAEVFRGLSEAEPDNREYRLELANVDSRLGVLFTESGKHAEAERYFRSARESVDSLIGGGDDKRFKYEAAGFSINHALLLNKVNQFEPARKLLVQAELVLTNLAADEQDSEVLERLGKARGELGRQLMMLGKTPEAVEKLEAAVAAYRSLTSLAPDHPPYLEGLASTRLSLANAHRLLGQDADVIASYEESIDDFGDLLNARPGVPHYRESLALARTDLAQFLSIAGRNPDAKEQASEALRAFIDLVNTYPTMYRYYAEHAICTQTLGIVLRDLDDNENAEIAFQDAIRRLDELTRAVSDVPDYLRRLAAAQSSLGRLLHKVGRHDEAEKIYLAAIANFKKASQAGLDDPLTHDPRAWCHTHLGSVLRELDRAEEARIHYVTAIGLRETMQSNPNHLDALARLLSNCDDVKLRDPERAIKLAGQAHMLVPQNPRFANGLGLAYYRAGEWDKSIQAIRTAIELRSFPDSADFFLLALAYRKSGDEDQAKLSYEQALQNMQAQAPGQIELLKLRAEAADTLGVNQNGP